MLALTIGTTAVVLPFSLWLLARNPFNIAAICSVLTWVFGVMPGIYFHYTGIVPSYSWRNFTFSDQLLHEYIDELALLVMCLMGASFTIGAYVAWITGRSIDTRPVPLRETSAAATYIMAGIWGLSVLYFLDLSGWDLKRFLLPIREHIPRTQQSGYLLTIFIMMPLAIVAKSYWAKGRINPWILLWIGLSIMAAFSRSQRRDFVTMALFVVGLLVLVGALLPKHEVRHGRAARKRGARPNTMVGLAMLAGAAALVPILWYSRVYFTSASRGKLVDPTDIRSFSDLLLGSPATGYPTLVLIRDYVGKFGSDFFYTPVYLIGTVMPRFIWPGKPMQIDGILEEHYNLTENPSSFWFGELFYSFGSLAVLMAVVLGYFMFKLSNAACTSNSILMRTIGVVIFMQCVTFYKNGFSQFAINGLMITAFIAFAWYFPVTRMRRSDSLGWRTASRPRSAPRGRLGWAGNTYRSGWASQRLRRS